VNQKKGFLARILEKMRLSGKEKRPVEKLGGFCVENESAKWIYFEKRVHIRVGGFQNYGRVAHGQGRRLWIQL